MSDKNKTIATLVQLVSGLSHEIQYLHAVIDNLPGSIYWKDTQSVYRGNNAFARETLKEAAGVTESVVGKTDYDIFDKHDAQMFRDFDARVMQTREVISRVEETITQSGEKTTQLSIKKPLYSSSGELMGVVGNTVDITEQKQVEQELRDAKDKLEIANNIKNEFIGNMTHDIRTPLAAIQSLSEDILLHSDNDLLQKNAHYLMRSGQELLNYFERIFEVLCLEKSKDKETKSCFKLHSSIRALLDIVMVSANNKKIGLNDHYDNKIPDYVKSYDTYLQRILLNLLINAIKFTDQGSVTLAVEVNRRESNKIWIDFIVTDTGIGISDKTKSVIYDKFSRGTASYNGQYHGAGVGLYIVKKLVGEMKGSIELESQLHVGSCFTCTLPFDIPSEDEIDEKLSVAVRSNLLSEQVVSEKKYFQETADSEINMEVAVNAAVPTAIRVLLIEDNKIAQYAEKSKLVRLSCKVDLADNAGQALALLEQNYYNLILCDVGLPDMDGFDLVRLIKRKFAQRYHNIVLLTAHVDRTVSNEIMEIVDAVYKKPLLLRDAKKIVNYSRDRNEI